MPTDFIELARICIAHSHVTASPEVAAELRRIAEEYRKKAADLEWENWPATFLFAPICEEANGMQLSVLSALARMDVDPWEEATRLAAMPKAIAERALVSTLDRVLGKGWNRSETEVIAARLVQLLPHRGEGGTIAPTETAR